MGGEGEDSTMMVKVRNDAVAYARSIAEQRGRNLDWAERIVRDGISTAANEALELKVIDLVASSEAEMLENLEGKRYFRHGQERFLKGADAHLAFFEMNWRQRILDTISNPTVAYMLMMLGLLGIFFEISQPGVILPGAVGAIALLLALFAFQTLPVNYAGLLLILLAMILFILEIKVASYGMLTVGGIVALALGSLMLIDSPDPYLQVSRGVIFATVTVCSSFFVFCLYYVLRTQKSRFQSGVEGMVGEQGRAVTAVHGGGQVFVHGEYWDAYAADSIAAGETVEIVRVANGMRLEVRRLE
jgi:membrane-bound serine protease (ClpP class)